MERLTFRHDCPYSHFHRKAEPCEPINCCDGYSKKALDTVVDRLAAYEDICFDADGKERITVDELSALVKARDEGRVVVLPCKVGDTAYWMWTDSEGNCEAPIHADRIYEIHITKDGVELSIQPYDGSIGEVGIHPPLAVFLTRAEAEAALGGGEDGL